MSRRRLILLTALFVPYAAVLAMISSLLWVMLLEGPLDGVGDWTSILTDNYPWYDEAAWWLVAFLPGLLIAATQYLFIIPVLRLRVRFRPGGRPLLLALAGAAFVAAMGTTALVLALSDVVWLVTTGTGREYDEPAFWGLILICYGVLGCSWMFWTPLLVIFSRRRPHRTTPGRLVGLLLGGTLAELLVILPVDILVRTRTSCHCVTASYQATWVAGLALVWLAGPGILVAVTSRRRRAWLDHHCDGCGYPKGPSPGPRCPECGRSWEPAGGAEKGDRRDSNP